MSARNRCNVVTDIEIKRNIGRTFAKSSVVWSAPPRHTGEINEAMNNCPVNKNRKRTSRDNRWRMCRREKTNASKANPTVIFAKGAADKLEIQSSGRA